MAKVVAAMVATAGMPASTCASDNARTADSASGGGSASGSDATIVGGGGASDGDGDGGAASGDVENVAVSSGGSYQDETPAVL